MARLFTIIFTYREKNYYGFVYPKRNGEETEFSVFVPDEGLHRILPDGRVVIDPKQTVKRNGSALVCELITTINKAIDEHEQVKGKSIW